MPTARNALASAYLNGFSYAISGSNGGLSATGEVDRIDLQAPTKPAGLSVTSAATATLSWSASSDNDSVSHYAISRDGAPIATAPNSPYVDTSASPGVGHSYTVSAVDPSGNTSAASNPVSTVVVTPLSLCNLTLQLTHGSTKYLGLSSRQRAAFDITVRALCAATLNPIKPGITPTRKRALVAIFQRGVNGLAAGGWLTSGQASELSTMATAL